jgi:hypothetical protein
MKPIQPTAGPRSRVSQRKNIQQKIVPAITDGKRRNNFLTTYLSWRWAFFINLPVGVLAIAGTLYYIGESKEEGTRFGFDLPGFVLITLGLGTVVYALIEGRQYGWWTPNPRHPFEIGSWTWPLRAGITSRFRPSFGSGAARRRGRWRRRRRKPSSGWRRSTLGTAISGSR